MHAELLHKLPAPSQIGSESIRWLVDNASAYNALLDAIASARTSVWISQLAFDADCVAYDTIGDGATDVAGRPLIDAVITASVGRGVDVRILLNASLLLDTAAPLRAFLARAGASAIEVRGLARFPQLLHAKVIVVDGTEVFLVGSPFANGYWDNTGHRPVNVRRPVRELGGRPLHDLSCAIRGPAVARFASMFAQLWNEVSTAPTALDALPEIQGAPLGAIQVARTAPRGALADRPDGIAEILPAIIAGIETARSLIYIEHQYLSARPVIAAIAAALKETPALEVIIVLNQNPDVTAYRGWQNKRLDEAALLDHPRVGLFALWSAERSAGRVGWDVNQVFVHSKLLAVDDVWATVGSANLDGVSLHSYGDDFSGRAARRIFRNVRNFDVNAVLDDRDGELGGAIRELRLRLWHEHLGSLTRANDELPNGGALAFWRARAAQNAAALRGDDPAALHAGFILPYSTRSAPRDQLAAFGIRLGTGRVRLHFNPSRLEVHCSPNWVRNMFA